MARDVTSITLDSLDELPKQCRKCVFWELAPHLAEQAAEYGSVELEKEAWVSGVLLEWGSCGKLARIDGLPAGTYEIGPGQNYAGPAFYSPDASPVGDSGSALSTFDVTVGPDDPDVVIRLYRLSRGVG